MMALGSHWGCDDGLSLDQGVPTVDAGSDASLENGGAAGVGGSSEAGQGGASGGSAGSGGGSAVLQCLAGQRQCHDGDVYECPASGNELLLQIDCGNNVCDAELMTCVARTCEPHTLGCRAGTRITLCNGSGSAIIDTGVDCAAMDQICYQGACQEGICVPGTRWCIDNEVHICAQDGSQGQFFQACGEEFVCLESTPGSASCSRTECTPNEPFCQFNAIKTCSTVGTIDDGQTDCGEDVCFEGVCEPEICEPGEFLCVDGDIHVCGFPGLTTALYYNCSEAGPCSGFGPSVDCVGQPCTPETTACLGNARGTCDTDGEDLASIEEDCTNTGDVCDVTGSCVQAAVDTMGIGDNSFGTAGTVGNIVDVHSTRLLTKIEAELAGDQLGDLLWTVYEIQDDETFDLVASDMTVNQSGNGFFASANLSYLLEAGKRYLFAVSNENADTVVFFDPSPWDARLSFGTIIRGGVIPPDLPDNILRDDGIYHLRLTTELP
jgi:hypothetical protein